LRSFLLELEEPPPYIELPPYNGRHVAVIESPAGECLALIG